MNNNYWKKKTIKKNAIKAYEKQNIKRFESIIEEFEDIEELLGFDDLLIQCIKDRKNYLFRYFLISIDFPKDYLRRIHVYLKENGLRKEEKLFILYTGQKNIKKQHLINSYLKVSNNMSYIYNA